jgi:hypothetical protein
VRFLRLVVASLAVVQCSNDLQPSVPTRRAANARPGRIDRPVGGERLAFVAVHRLVTAHNGLPSRWTLSSNMKDLSASQRGASASTTFPCGDRRLPCAAAGGTIWCGSSGRPPPHCMRVSGAGFVPLVAASERLVRSHNVRSVVAVNRGVLMFSGQRPGVGP